MADKEQLDILLKGPEVWNEWRVKHKDVGVELSSADLSRANLRDAKLIGADLIGADLSSAILRNVNLSSANLSNATLSSAILRNVNLSSAILSGATLSYAKLIGADLRDANLSSAILSSAILNRANLSRSILDNANLNNSYFGTTILADLDLSKVLGLASAQHYGPSSISIDTLYKSGGSIPESFLRGCGVPDDFITFIPSHFGIKQAIQFYSCFISYSTKDEEFARRLYSRMRDEHLRVWFAPEDVKGGQKLYEQIERAIQLHDRLLIVLSQDSMQSEWVITEIRNARRTEVEEKRRKLFPISLVDYEAIRKWKCFDGDTGKDMAVEIREYFIPDFSDWKDHDAFEKGFARLLRDLRDEEAKP